MQDKLNQLTDAVLEKLLNYLQGNQQNGQQTKAIQKQTKPATTVKQAIQSKPGLNLQNLIEAYSKQASEYRDKLSKLGSIYQTYQEEYQKTSEAMQNHLNKVMNYALVYLAKTPLASLTSEDFLTHINKAINVMPFNALNDGIQKLVKGYYMAKQTGMDTSGLTFTDLFHIAEDPTYIKGYDENTLKMIDLTSKTIANGLQKQLEAYKTKTDALTMQSEVIKTAYTMLDREVNTITDAIKVMLDNAYKNAMLSLQRQELAMRGREKDFLDKLRDISYIANIMSNVDYRQQNVDLKQQQIDLKRQQTESNFESFINNLTRPSQQQTQPSQQTQQQIKIIEQYINQQYQPGGGFENYLNNINRSK